MRRLVAVCALVSACSQPPAAAPVVAAWWPHGFGRVAPGTDSVTVCALVTMPDGRLLVGHTAAHVTVRGDSARFVLVAASACGLPYPTTAVRWVLGTTPSGQRVPHPQRLQPVPHRERS